jgi:hypothetical protein
VTPGLIHGAISADAAETVGVADGVLDPVGEAELDLDVALAQPPRAAKAVRAAL